MTEIKSLRCALAGLDQAADDAETLVDAHLGDPAEDFRWQLLGGMKSEDYLAMAEEYVKEGGRLGEHAAHRLAVPVAELCFDMLGWSIPAAEKECCISTLEELASGVLPQWPGP